jgi:hypothetical protein
VPPGGARELLLQLLSSRGGQAAATPAAPAAATAPNAAAAAAAAATGGPRKLGRPRKPAPKAAAAADSDEGEAGSDETSESEGEDEINLASDDTDDGAHRTPQKFKAPRQQQQHKRARQQQESETTGRRSRRRGRKTADSNRLAEVRTQPELTVAIGLGLAVCCRQACNPHFGYGGCSFSKKRPTDVWRQLTNDGVTGPQLLTQVAALQECSQSCNQASRLVSTGLAVHI